MRYPVGRRSSKCLQSLGLPCTTPRPGPDFLGIGRIIAASLAPFWVSIAGGGVRRDSCARQRLQMPEKRSADDIIPRPRLGRTRPPAERLLHQGFRPRSGTAPIQKRVAGGGVDPRPPPARNPRRCHRRRYAATAWFRRCVIEARVVSLREGLAEVSASLNFSYIERGIEKLCARPRADSFGYPESWQESIE